MKIFVIFVVIAVIQLQSVQLQSRSPTCGVYDFNDELILNEFRDCKEFWYGGDQSLIIKSYNESSLNPYRPTSERFLTTNPSISNNMYQYLCTKALFSGNFSSMSLKIGIFLSNNDTRYYNSVQFFVSNIWAEQIETISTNGWVLFERHSTYESRLGTFSDSLIGIRATINANSALSIEYIKFYDPQRTDENCVPFKTPTTQSTETDPPVITITSEANTPVTETPTSDYNTTEIPPNDNYSCMKIDFSQSTSVSNIFRECNGSYLPGLIVKSYQNSTIPTFRETSLYYLSNKWEGLSCLESSSLFSLNETSVIESAIYLNGLWPGAWIEVYVLDVFTRRKYVAVSLESGNSNEWKLVSGIVNGTFDNAQIIIKTNMNSYSQLAVEYLNILNE